MPVTATIADQDPAPSATDAGTRSPAASIYPTNPGGNALASWTFEVDGVAYTPTVTALSAGGRRLVAPGVPRRLGQVRTVEITATTADANVNTFSYSYTERPAYTATPGPVEYAFPFWSATPGPTDYARPGAGVTPGAVDWALPASGVLAATPAPVDYAVGVRTSGVLGAIPVPTDYKATQRQIHAGLSMSAVLSEWNRGELALSSTIESRRAQTVLALMAMITSTQQHPGLAMSATIGVFERSVALALSGVVTAVERGHLGLAAEISSALARFLARYTTVPASYEDVERGDL